jgi:hypothetical protein
MDNNISGALAGLTGNLDAPARRRLLCGALALLGLGAMQRLIPIARVEASADGVVIIDGWVIPTRYFQD